MGEFRKDPVSGRWVIIASDRPSKPTDFHVEKTLPTGGFCPFCEGNEDKTPNEIAALRDAGSAPDRPGWRVRVVPNKFPALRVEGALDKAHLERKELVDEARRRAGELKSNAKRDARLLVDDTEISIDSSERTVFDEMNFQVEHLASKIIEKVSG